jgi:hypothetical protein
LRPKLLLSPIKKRLKYRVPNQYSNHQNSRKFENPNHCKVKQRKNRIDDKKM